MCLGIPGRIVETQGGGLMRMGKVETPEEWTEMSVSAVEFDIELPAGVFTLSNLRNPRQ